MGFRGGASFEAFVQVLGGYTDKGLAICCLSFLCRLEHETEPETERFQAPVTNTAAETASPEPPPLPPRTEETWNDARKSDSKPCSPKLLCPSTASSSSRHSPGGALKRLGDDLCLDPRIKTFRVRARAARVRVGLEFLLQLSVATFVTEATAAGARRLCL